MQDGEAASAQCILDGTMLRQQPHIIFLMVRLPPHSASESLTEASQCNEQLRREATGDRPERKSPPRGDRPCPLPREATGHHPVTDKFPMRR